MQQSKTTTSEIFKSKNIYSTDSKRQGRLAFILPPLSVFGLNNAQMNICKTNSSRPPSSKNVAL
jgi:hypothetical protein